MKNNLSRNIFFSFLSWFLPLVSTFLVTPLVVQHLGVEEYGLLTLILGFISYSFNFGISRAVIKYVAEYRVKNDIKSAEKILSATLFLNLLVSVLGTIVLILLSRFLVQDILLIEADSQAKTMTALYLAAAVIAVYMLQTVFSSVLQAVERYDWFSLVTTLISTLFSIGNLVLASLGGNVITLLWWNLAITISGVAIFFFAAQRAFPEASWVIAFDRKSFWQVLRFSLGVVGYQICGNALLLFERSWITRVYGTEGVAFYTVPMILAIQLHLFITTLAMSLMPLSSKISAEEDLTSLVAVYRRATKYICLVGTFAVVALSTASREFLTLWLGAEFGDRSSNLLVIHMLTFGMMGVGIVAWQVVEGLGFPMRNAYLVLLWLLLALPLIIFLTPLLELEGVAAARAISVLLTVPIFIVLIERLTFGKIQWIFWQQTIASLFLAAGVCGLLLYFWFDRAPLGWINFLMAQLAAGIIYLGSLFLIGFFTPEEQDWFRQFFSRALTAN